MQGDIAGWHLLVDAEVNDAKNLNDEEFLEDFFINLIKLLDMEILMPPTFKKVPIEPKNLKNDDDDGGVTGICVITTSHLSIHTWPLRNKFSLDIYSCKPFDLYDALNFVKNELDVSKCNYQSRIRHWP
jgi:S-adenosylmethionine decarboxylase